MIDKTLTLIMDEALLAHRRYGPPTSTHEALGVLLEEFDELKDAIHANAGEHIAREAIQLAAVAYRLADELLKVRATFYERSGLEPPREAA